MSNPLLEMDGLPPFSQIKPEHIEPALDALCIFVNGDCEEGIHGQCGYRGNERPEAKEFEWKGINKGYWHGFGH